MRLDFLLISIALFACNLSVEAAGKTLKHALSLNETEVRDGILSGGLWFIEFYAPWCGHCQKLSPILDEVAEALKDQPNTFIAKVDATIYKNISHDYNIKSYPTLIYAKDGVIGRYEGARNKDAFITFMTRLVQSTYHTVSSTDELEAKLKSLPYAFVLSLPDPHIQMEKWLQLLASIASLLHMKIDFILHSHAGITDVSFQKMEAGRSSIQFTMPADTSDVPSLDSIEQFVLRFNRRLVTEFDNHNFKPLASLNHPLCLLVLDYQHNLPTNKNTLSPMATALTSAFDRAASRAVIPPPEHAWDDLVLGHVDGVKWRFFFMHYGVDTSTLPSLLFLNLTTEAYAPFTLPRPTFDENGNLGDDQMESYMATIESTVAKLIREYQEGKVEMQIFKKPTFMDRLIRPLRKYYPWSLLIVVPFVVTMVALIAPNPAARGRNKILKKE